MKYIRYSTVYHLTYSVKVVQKIRISLRRLVYNNFITVQNYLFIFTHAQVVIEARCSNICICDENPVFQCAENFTIEPKTPDWTVRDNLYRMASVWTDLNSSCKDLKQIHVLAIFFHFITMSTSGDLLLHTSVSPINRCIRAEARSQNSGSSSYIFSLTPITCKQKYDVGLAIQSSFTDYEQQ